jgi:hypothetical protein
MDEVVSLGCLMQPRQMSAYWRFFEVRRHPIHVRHLEEKRTAVDGVVGETMTKMGPLAMTRRTIAPPLLQMPDAGADASASSPLLEAAPT